MRHRWVVRRESIAECLDAAGFWGNASAVRRARRGRLFVPVSDSTLRQVVRRELEGDAVSIHNFDSIAPESSGHCRENRFSRIEFNGKHAGLELLDYLTHYFD
jgi:hypothetical protein